MTLPANLQFVPRPASDVQFFPSVIPVQSVEPAASALVWVDTSTVPATLKGWNGTAWVAIGGGTGGGLTTEDVDDRVAALIVAGTNITKTYNDTAGTLTLDAAAEPADFVRVQRSTNQSIPNATLTAITWDVESEDAGGFHSTVSNTDRLTVPTGKAGVYLVHCSMSFAADADGSRSNVIRKNGATVADFGVPASPATDWTTIQNSVVLRLAATDYVTAHAVHAAGNALDVLAAAPSYFSMVRIGA